LPSRPPPYRLILPIYRRQIIRNKALSLMN
jgi:hypothetical protein